MFSEWTWKLGLSLFDLQCLFPNVCFLFLAWKVIEFSCFPSFPSTNRYECGEHGQFGVGEQGTVLSGSN